MQTGGSHKFATECYLWAKSLSDISLHALIIAFNLSPSQKME